MKYFLLLGMLLLSHGAQAATTIYVTACNAGVAITGRYKAEIAGTLVSPECPPLTGRHVRITLPASFDTDEVQALRIRLGANRQWIVTGMIVNGLPVLPQTFPPISVMVWN